MTKKHYSQCWFHDDFHPRILGYRKSEATAVNIFCNVPNAKQCILFLIAVFWLQQLNCYPQNYETVGCLCDMSVA